MTTLTYHFQEKAELKKAYLPYIKHGGLIIPTKRSLPLHSDVVVNVRFFDDPDTFSFAGKVVLVSTKSAQYHMLIGVGVQFGGAEADKLRKKN